MRPAVILRGLMALFAGGFSTLLLISVVGEVARGAYPNDFGGLVLVVTWNFCVIGCAVLTVFGSAKGADHG